MVTILLPHRLGVKTASGCCITGCGPRTQHSTDLQERAPLRASIHNVELIALLASGVLQLQRGPDVKMRVMCRSSPAYQRLYFRDVLEHKCKLLPKGSNVDVVPFRVVYYNNPLEVNRSISSTCLSAAPSLNRAFRLQEVEINRFPGKQQ